jgi:circadian clock protein KaiB
MRKEKTAEPDHDLRLYVAGTGAKSLHAIRTLTRLCERELAGRYHLEIVDVYRNPARAVEDQVVAIPTLIKRAPGVIMRLVGDLSQEARVRAGLGLAA